MIIINFKNYLEGKKVLEVSKILQKTNRKDIILCPPLTHLSEISEKIKIPIYSQHTNSKISPKSTGFTTAESLKKLGVKGTLLNHSEHPIYPEILKRTIKECKQKKIRTIVCASTISEVKQLKKLTPFAIAFEDTRLISTGRSITEYNPKAIKKFIKILKKTKIVPICGAGISSLEDYNEALNLGCKGVLVSSAIVNKKNPKDFFKL